MCLFYKFLISFSIFFSSMALCKIEDNVYKNDTGFSFTPPANWKLFSSCKKAPIILTDGTVITSAGMPCLVHISGNVELIKDSTKKTVEIWGEIISRTNVKGDIFQTTKTDFNKHLDKYKDMTTVDSPFMTTLSGQEAVRSGYTVLTKHGEKISPYLYEDWVFKFKGKTYELELGSHDADREQLIQKMIEISGGFTFPKE